MKLSLTELFDKVEAASKGDRLSILKSQDNIILRTVLEHNFNPDCVYDLPEGAPPYKKDTGLPYGVTDSSLRAEYRRLYIFLKSYDKVPKMRKETLFIQVLEGIHWTDAEVLCLIKDKALQEKWPSLTAELVKELYPNMKVEEPPKEVAPVEDAPAKKGRGRPRKTPV